MKSAVTLCRVAEAAAGPFVFHGPLEAGFEKAAALGFDAVELFLGGPDEVPVAEIKALQEKHGLAIAAVGTGAGMVKHGLSLTDPDHDKRLDAFSFIMKMIAVGGELGAPAILGSMQGRWGPQVDRDEALSLLGGFLGHFDRAAGAHGVPFIYEPLNRYETNLFNRVADAARWLDAKNLRNIVILADLFHMNIEERAIADSLRDIGGRLGHVHWADSNRRAMGFGHTDPAPIFEALQEIGYRGYLSAEIFPLPDADTAAARTIESIKSLIP